MMLSFALAIPNRSLAQPAPTAWPLFHHDIAHTGRSSVDTSGNPGQLKWSFGTTFQQGPADLVFSSPAIGADSTVYVGIDQSLCAVNPDGTEKWKFTTGALVASSPAIAADGTIYVGSQDGGLYAVTDGGSSATRKWRFAAGAAFDAPPTISADGTIYFGAQQKFYALNPDGTVKWTLDTAGMDESVPAIGSDGTIYFGTYDGTVWAVTDGGQGSVSTKWTFKQPADADSSPAIGSDGTIYLLAQDGTLYALADRGTSAVAKWAFSTGTFVPAFWASPAIGAAGTIYFAGSDGSFYAVTDNATSVGLKWTVPISASNSAPAIGADGTIYVAFDGGTLFALRDDGAAATTLWSCPDADTFVSSPAIGPDGTIYVGSAYDNLVAVGTAPPPAPVRLTIGPRVLRFGTVRVGKSKTLKITVRNPRGSRRRPGLAVQMQGRSLVGFNSPFSVNNGCLGALPPGTKCEFQVTFEPYQPLEAKYAMLIYDNANNEPQIVWLFGRTK